MEVTPRPSASARAPSSSAPAADENELVEGTPAAIRIRKGPVVKRAGRR